MAVGMVVSTAAGIAVMVMFVCLIMRSVGVIMSAATGIVVVVMYVCFIMRFVGVLMSAAAGFRAKSFCKTDFIQHRDSSLI